MLWYTTLDIPALLKQIVFEHEGLWMSLSFVIGITYANGLVKGLATSMVHSMTYNYRFDSVHMTSADVIRYYNADAIGSIFACFFTPLCLRCFGRIRTIQVAVFAIGCVISTHSLVSSVESYIKLRTVIGCFNFAVSIATAYYLTEVSPDRSRAFCAGLAVATYNLGISSINAAATLDFFSWEVQAFAVSAACLGIVQLTWTMAEESPRWYIQKGLKKEARMILKRIHRNVPQFATAQRLTFKHNVSVTNPVMIVLLVVLYLQDLFIVHAPLFVLREAYRKSGFYIRVENLRSILHLVYGTTVLSMAPCYDRMYRLSNLYISMLLMSIVSVLFVIISGVLIGADFSSHDDWFLFRCVIIMTLFYVVTHAFSVALLPLFLMTEYMPINRGTSLNVVAVLTLSRIYTVLGLDYEETPRYLIFQWLVRGIAAVFFLPVPLPLYVPETAGVSLSAINWELNEVYS